MFKRIALILFAPIPLYLILFLLQSCCGNIEPTCHTITKISLVAYDNSESNPEVHNGDDIIAEAFMLRLFFEDETKMCSANNIVPFLFGSKAYAMCRVPQIVDTIIKLSIVSNNDFDKTHLAGEDLSRYFKIPEFYYVGSSESDLYLLKQPAENGVHRFTVKINMSDGKYLEASAAPVNLIK